MVDSTGIPQKFIEYLDTILDDIHEIYKASIIKEEFKPEHQVYKERFHNFKPLKRRFKPHKIRNTLPIKFRQVDGIWQN